MDDEFSQSLTPPVSPFMDSVEELGDSSLSRPPCFSCAFEKGREETRALSSDSYISRGVLKRSILKLDPAPADFEVDTVDLFGFSWVTETALLESTQLLFGLFRQKVFRLETLVQSSSHDFGQASSLHYEAEELRQQCVLFLTYVKVFIHRFVEEPDPLAEEFSSSFSQMEAQFPSALVEQLFSVTLLIGRLKDLPANVQSVFTIHHQGKLFPPSWHLLHLHLDVHWAILEILHIFGQKMTGQVVYARRFVDLTGETLTNVSLFEDHLNNLLCDLITLAMNKYSKVRPTEAVMSHHYQCVCTKEMWILLIHFLEHRSKTLHTQSFWGYVNALLDSILKGAPSGVAAHCKDVLGFTWWLITHLAQLGMYNRNGVLQNEKQLDDNWSFVCNLLKSSCDVKAAVQEEQMRMYVHCCLTLSMVWVPSLRAINTLWDFFSKNLNGSFSVPWLGVSGLASIGSTPLALLEQAKSCCSPAPLNSANHAHLYSSTNSFLIFLRMLALHLKQESGDPWRQIKGRIYSKFHERRMAELSESGLHHFLLLFLVLSLRADLEDATGRAFDLLALRLPAATAVMSWRGRLALLLGFVERGVDVGGAATRISASFSSAAREFYLKTTPVPRRTELWRLISAYLEGVGQVWQSSATLCLSEEKLINEGFGLLLPACGAKELDTVLDFLQMALTQLRRVQQCSQCAGAALPLGVVKERHLAVAVTLWTHFLPFLRTLRMSQTPPEELAHAAAGFTLLALDLPNSAPQDLQPRPLLAMIQCFGWDEMLRPLLVTRYLNNLLQNEELVHKMCSAGDSAQALCVRAWIRCIVQQHQHNNTDTHNSRTDRTLEEQLAEMTSLILRLPEVESLLQRAGLNTNAAMQESKAALTLFIKCVGRVYCGLQQQAERVSLVCKALEYVGDIMKFIKPNLLNKSTEGLHITYWTLGCVVKHWSPLLATSKAQSLLLRIIDVLLLPHSLLQDKAPPPQLISAIRDTLPLYLQGLSVAVGVSQTQVSYLKQQLRSVITQYLSRFLPVTPTIGAVANHPVLMAGCEAIPTARGAALRRTILQALRENFLHFRGHAPPPRLAAVLMFLLELLRRNNDSDPTLLTVPLRHVLRCVMLVNEPQVKKLSTESVQLIVERCSSAAREEPCEQLITVLRAFVEESEGVYELQMYSALETVAILSPLAVSTLIPILSQSLRNTEQKRGIGKNTSLRNAYRTLLALLGDAGQAEMIVLEED
ncbi:protein MMS22-like isoform X2 [Ictalurus punctatus]|uniref:Protein MMS22-like n=1 Tax=Ictalurus punctatus TaxID=7998 RepID=A0A2D0TAN1_ICTPU|nr:protein MMS22-like isoform X2 [Ictalurus punctatus]